VNVISRLYDTVRGYPDDIIYTASVLPVQGCKFVWVCKSNLAIAESLHKFRHGYSDTNHDTSGVGDDVRILCREVATWKIAVKDVANGDGSIMKEFGVR
jgi:hypothetical protein